MAEKLKMALWLVWERREGEERERGRERRRERERGEEREREGGRVCWSITINHISPDRGKLGQPLNYRG